ncbi:MAG: Hsp70 family protein [Zavarzinella sp.]
MSIIGIDLGTTYCAVATLDDRGQATSLPNHDGEMLTPSAVMLVDSTKAVVGQAALDVGLEQPDRVATLIKRRMGYDSFPHAVAGRVFRPETLSAIILRKLMLDASARIGPVQQCVITVPAYFDDTRRKATKDAGQIAGLEVLDILDEPSAAALSYSFQHREQELKLPQTVLVYDLGGGTFDVTIVRLTPKKFHVLAIKGDVQLGGRDWDHKVVEHAARLFREKFDEDPLSDPQATNMLYAAAERAKRTLSKLDQATITCNHAGRKLTVTLTRQEFEALTSELLTRTRLSVMAAIRDAGMQWHQIDRVLMVGGSTHMPSTKKMLLDLSGKMPDQSLAVSEVVARGAALHAGILQAKNAARNAPQVTSRSPLQDIVEIRVNAHGLGIEVRKDEERLNDQLIPRNSQLPASATRVYYTVSPNQSRVRVRVLQGDAVQAEGCIPVGECWIQGLPEALPKGSPIQVKCSVGENGIIEVTALDMTSGRSARAELVRSSGLSADQLATESEFVQNLVIE